MGAARAGSALDEQGGKKVDELHGVLFVLRLFMGVVLLSTEGWELDTV